MKKAISANKNISKYPEVIDAKMLSEILHISYGRALKILKSGSIPAVKIDSTYRVSKSALLEWMGSPGVKEIV